ncbi:DUF3347 domain-containing protein [Halobacteriovorax sp. HLS]|uniref:DUF3347 domain-containing protein n=1 Tax=Halobacteriovorax sp. HLS TaxID=2234000 RepID=UPI000FDB4CE9|nr:DUF3347 domain-containing protein [Halobacteriovorax sp. HLS]
MQIKPLSILAILVGLNFSLLAMEDHDHSKMKESKTKITRKALDESTKKSVIKVLEINENLHASFFKYNPSEIDKNAKALKMAIVEIKNDEISKILKFATTKIDMITADAKRKDNNDNYHLVSMALIHVVNSYDIGGKYNAYSCPMVKKKWIQDSDKNAKVNNPYAPYMPHCGSKDSSY